MKNYSDAMTADNFFTNNSIIQTNFFNINPANINEVDKLGMTPLLWATYNEDISLVKKLINKGALVNCSDDSGQTPLHIAAELGQIEILKTLINAGAMLSAKDNMGRTPLYMATTNNHKKVVLMLMQHLDSF